MLTQQQTELFKNRLLDMRDHMLDRIDRMNNNAMGDSMTNSFGELSTYDNHPGDVGSEMFERGKDFALREEAMITLGAIDDALDKMEKGNYGRCEACQQEIPYERLDAVPYTTQCVDCKSRDEHLPKSHERTVEEDVLEVPFSRTWKDKDLDYNGFDGEDTWETVANWNEHAAHSQAGSYYGDNELVDIGDTGVDDDFKEADDGNEIDNIPYEVGDDGVIYKDFRGVDDEHGPYEKIELGNEHHKTKQDI